MEPIKRVDVASQVAEKIKNIGIVNNLIILL
jgi:hypothetical protein